MMIVELIDGEDFRQRLVALGVRIPEGSCPETCARLAAGCHRTTGVEGLEACVRELMAKSEILLPSVKQATEQHLVPALSQVQRG